MDGIRDACQHRHVVIVPQLSSMKGVISEVWWISTCSVQSTAQPPSALTRRIGVGRRVAIAGAVAMRHLIKAVLGRHRPIFHG